MTATQPNTAYTQETDYVGKEVTDEWYGEGIVLDSSECHESSQPETGMVRVKFGNRVIHMSVRNLSLVE